MLKVLANINIAIIGDAVAETLARRLAQAGHTMFVGMVDATQLFIGRRPKNMSFVSIAEAAADADIVIIATTPGEVRDVAYQLGDVRRKVVIDYSNFVTGYMQHTAAAITAITHCQHIAKCFAPTSYEDMIIPGINEVGIDMFVAGNSKKAKAVVTLLAVDMGYQNHYDLGGNGAVKMLDEMANYTYRKGKAIPEVVYVKK
jgi:predicted dinucleotide-binding enzyme